jgi:hypothetical protein
MAQTPFFDSPPSPSLVPADPHAAACFLQEKRAGFSSFSTRTTVCQDRLGTGAKENDGLPRQAREKPKEK